MNELGHVVSTPNLFHQIFSFRLFSPTFFYSEFYCLTFPNFPFNLFPLFLPLFLLARMSASKSLDLSQKPNTSGSGHALERFLEHSTFRAFLGQRIVLALPEIVFSQSALFTHPHVVSKLYCMLYFVPINSD